MRAAQILENQRRREKERAENKVDEDSILAECKLKLREEKEIQVRTHSLVGSCDIFLHTSQNKVVACDKVVWI